MVRFVLIMAAMLTATLWAQQALHRRLESGARAAVREVVLNVDPDGPVMGTLEVPDMEGTE